VSFSGSDEAVCVRRWEWSETSQTVLLFGREAGLIRGLAKGARRERSSFSGGFEPLTRGRLHAILKRDTSLATLTSWDLEETFPAIRSVLSAFHAGMYLAWLVAAAFREHDPHPRVYDLLVETLRGLRRPLQSGALLLRFQWAVIVEIGYKPELEIDVLTGAAVGSGRVLGFDPARGGVVDLEEAKRAGALAAGSWWRVRRGTIEALRVLGTEDGAPVDDDEVLARANRLLCAYLAAVLGTDPPSADAVFGGGPRKATRIPSPGGG